MTQHIPFPVQDSVPGYPPVMVVATKGTDKGECMRCFYCRRGSFKGMTARMFRKLLRKHPALRDKFLATFI